VAVNTGAENARGKHEDSDLRVVSEDRAASILRVCFTSSLMVVRKVGIHQVRKPRQISHVYSILHSASLGLQLTVATYFWAASAPWPWRSLSANKLGLWMRPWRRRGMFCYAPSQFWYV